MEQKPAANAILGRYGSVRAKRVITSRRKKVDGNWGRECGKNVVSFE